MAEKYLACYPVTPCPTCGANKTPGVEKCSRCWNLWQTVNTHAVKLLSNPLTAPACRELLEAALKTQAEAKETP